MPSPTLRIFLLALACTVLAPAHAEEADPKRCRYIKVATVPIRYSGPELAITMEGAINGTPASLLVDTGADFSALTHTGTERRGINLWATGSVARGVGGYSRVYSARVKEFVAGPTRGVNSTMRVIGDFGSPPSYDAIVGSPFLLQADLEFSLADKQITFFRPSNCGDSFLAYWDQNAVAVPFERGFSRSTNPQFRVLLNGKKLSAIIDTGAQTTLVTLDAAKRTGLKLDAPGVRRSGDILGVGEERVARWSAVFDKLEIGAQTITNAQVGVVDAQLSVDLILGADFLRSHRVLFAMSQEKLYLSYIGGQPLGHATGIEPWVIKEAEDGNADAQMTLARHHGQGRGVPRDAALSRSWLERAAANGSPEANLVMGQGLVMNGRHAQAVAHLRKAIDTRPGERHGALWLYAARLGSGEAELGRRELAAAFSHDDDEWPGAIARFYLGKLGQDKLLEEARDDRKRGPARACLARRHIAQQLAATGDADGARTMVGPGTECAAPAGAPKA